jgi:hypothetical protein
MFFRVRVRRSIEPNRFCSAKFSSKQSTSCIVLHSKILKDHAGHHRYLESERSIAADSRRLLTVFAHREKGMDKQPLKITNTHRDQWMALLDKNGVRHPKALRVVEVPGGLVQATVGEPPGHLRLDSVGYSFFPGLLLIVGQCPGILNGPQCRDTGTLARF